MDEQLEEISQDPQRDRTGTPAVPGTKGTVDLSEESKAYLEARHGSIPTGAKAELGEVAGLPVQLRKSNKDLDQLAPSSLGTPDPLLIDLIGQLKNLQTNVAQPAVRCR